MLLLVQIYLFITLFMYLLFIITGGCLWWAIEGLYVSGIHIVGGVNRCIYSRIYTGNTLKKRTPTPVGVPPPSRGGGIMHANACLVH